MTDHGSDGGEGTQSANQTATPSPMPGIGDVVFYHSREAIVSAAERAGDDPFAVDFYRPFAALVVGKGIYDEQHGPTLHLAVFDPHHGGTRLVQNCRVSPPRTISDLPEANTWEPRPFNGAPVAIPFQLLKDLVQAAVAEMLAEDEKARQEAGTVPAGPAETAKSETDAPSC